MCRDSCHCSLAFEQSQQDQHHAQHSETLGRCYYYDFYLSFFIWLELPHHCTLKKAPVQLKGYITVYVQYFTFSESLHDEARDLLAE